MSFSGGLCVLIPPGSGLDMSGSLPSPITHHPSPNTIRDTTPTHQHNRSNTGSQRSIVHARITRDETNKQKRTGCELVQSQRIRFVWWLLLVQYCIATTQNIKPQQNMSDYGVMRCDDSCHMAICMPHTRESHSVFAVPHW